MTSKSLLEKLLSQTENEVLEFKSAQRNFDKDKLGKYFSALSNQANLQDKEQAYLVFGVDDNKQIVGTSIDEKTLNEYKLAVAHQTNPSSDFLQIDKVKINDKQVIILHIPPAPQGIPVSWKGHYYARSGESLSALNIEKVERIRRQSAARDWSAGIIHSASIDDLDLDAISFARKEYAKKNPKLAEEMQQWDNTTFLNKAKVCINGQITRTAIILLGKAESEHYISPANAKITWVLKDRDNIEKDYQHFTCPLLIEVSHVANKIRNLTYRYIKDGSLFPDEVEQFDPYIIREALNNCIAHQDYEMGDKINVVEHEDGMLTFLNSGTFIPESIEQVIEADAPENNYRNPFLATAMVNLNMIDTIGSGIKKMFVIQKNKYFPLPEYDFAKQKIKMQIVGKVTDINYARKLAESKDLTLSEIILLDKVAKGKEITAEESKQLRKKKLIEGRKPNYIISARIATVTEEQARYIKQRGFNDDYYMQLIMAYIQQFDSVSRAKIDELLFDKLPDILDYDQKKNKIRYLLQKLKKDKSIKLNEKREWILY